MDQFVILLSVINSITCYEKKTIFLITELANNLIMLKRNHENNLKTT